MIRKVFELVDIVLPKVHRFNSTIPGTGVFPSLHMGRDLSTDIIGHAVDEVIDTLRRKERIHTQCKALDELIFIFLILEQDVKKFCV
jgi:hypothetical protein